MSNSFRIDSTELVAWHDAIAKRMDLRGVPAIAKEIEAHLGRKEPDGTVVVTRHQLFTWAEALQGASARDGGPALPPVIAEMRAILTGRPAGAPPPTRVVPGPYGGAVDAFKGAFDQQIVVTDTSPARPKYAPPPPVTYSSSGQPASGTNVLTGAPLADATRQLIRSATRELYVSSPWATGVETLIADITALPPAVRVLILSRRPERDDATFHQAMDQLGRRRAVTAWSPFIQTRMVIADDTRAIVGAASVPSANSREVGVLVTDAATIRELRAAFERAHLEAAGGKY